MDSEKLVRSTIIDGGSKEEYDASLPYLVGLFKLNYNNTSVLQISASGTGHDGYSNCLVEITNEGWLISI